MDVVAAGEEREEDVGRVVDLGCGCGIRTSVEVKGGPFLQFLGDRCGRRPQARAWWDGLGEQKARKRNLKQEARCPSCSRVRDVLLPKADLTREKVDFRRGFADSVRPSRADLCNQVQT